LSSPEPSQHSVGGGGAVTEILEIDEVDSTNAEALRRAAGGERGPVWISAKRQIAGRGRAGRSWQMEAGNLAATLLLSPGCAPDKLYQLSLIAGVAIHDAVAPLHSRANAAPDTRPRLKWPNDILAGTAKLGGILIESTIFGNTTVAAIGIGVNIAAAPRIDGRATAALADWGVAVDRRTLIEAIDARLLAWLDVWQAGAGFGSIRAAWLDRAGPAGEPMTVNVGNETVRGTFAGMDETGALLVDTVPASQTTRRRFTFGDVSIGPGQTEGSSQQ
jgi:BirA family biotin operon repressor/biotin-[acetyl-CoA-carboxylase] ligase